jgi:two-component system, OmpR family, response regulator PrrA
MHVGSVLVVEDDIDVRNAVTHGLRVHGFSVESVATAETALAAIERRRPDVVILDVGLPGMSGVDLCLVLNDRGDDVPVLILSARDAVGDRVAGLQAGADDYLVKPFDLTELVARTSALLRRAQIRTAPARTVTVGSLRIETERRMATADACRLDLTRREFDLLSTFALNVDVVLSRTQLLESVWGYDFDVDTNVVDVFVGYLRRKLAEAGAAATIRTVRGVGFVLEAA